MNFTLGEVSGVRLLRVFENITYINQKEFLELVEKIRSGKCRKVVLDLSKLGFLGSLGIGAIAQFYQQMKQKQGKLVIVKPPKEVFKVFSLTGLAKVIPFFDDEESALADFGISSTEERLVEKGSDDEFEDKLKRLKDDNPEVRRYVAWSLGLTSDTRAVEPLEQALRDPSNEVREAAADALKKLTGRIYQWDEVK